MLSREQILALIPHQGTMCLLDRVVSWSADAVVCGASSHLSPDNPLRRDARLGAICGIEYGLQAAALHGALAAQQSSLPLRAWTAKRTKAGGRGRDVPLFRPLPLLFRPLPLTPSHKGRGDALANRHGYLAALRDVALHVDRLDDPAFGILQIAATAELLSPAGSIYRFAIESEAAAPLLHGRATIALAALPA